MGYIDSKSSWTHSHAHPESIGFGFVNHVKGYEAMNSGHLD